MLYPSVAQPEIVRTWWRDSAKNDSCFGGVVLQLPQDCLLCYGRECHGRNRIVWPGSRDERKPSLEVGAPCSRMNDRGRRGMFAEALKCGDRVLDVLERHFGGDANLLFIKYIHNEFSFYFCSFTQDLTCC